MPTPGYNAAAGDVLQNVITWGSLDPNNHAFANNPAGWTLTWGTSLNLTKK
jgi:hypothetical protein